ESAIFVSTTSTEYDRPYSTWLRYAMKESHLFLVHWGLKSADARTRAFQRSMQEIGLAVDESLITEGDHTIESGVAACAQLLALSNRPTAIMCSNDMTALGVMRKAYEEGITIPQDLSVIGFDDIHLAQFVLPALTTVQMSQAELARLAFHALFEETQREQAMP